MPGLWCASEKDVPDLCEMAREFYGMSPFADRLFSPAGTKRYIEAIIADRNSVIFRTDDGAIGGTCEPLPFSVSIMARELFWFAPGTGDGIRLLQQYEKWAKSHGANLIKMSAMINDRVDAEKVSRVLKRFDYEFVEYGLMKGS
jgi:hypothetical protein